MLLGKSVLLCEYTLALVLVSEIAHASSHQPVLHFPTVRHIDVLVGSKETHLRSLAAAGILLCSPNGE